MDQANSRLDYISGPKGALKPGLDESWAWALNAATATSYIYGKDLIFTYGPLGFLMSPRPIGHNLQWASAFAVCIRVIFAAMLGILALNARTKQGFLLFLAGSITASAFGLWDEYLYRIVMGLCLLVVSLTSPFAIPACVIAGALTPMLLLIKFSVGLTSISMMAVMTLILIFRGKAWHKIFALWLSATLSLTFWVFLLLRNAGNFGRWLALSWEVSSGYGAAMSVAGPPAEAIAGILLLAAMLFSAVLLKGNAAIPSLLFAIPAALALKHGFVGDSGMATAFFTFMVAAASAVFLFAETRHDWRVAGLLWSLTFAAAIYKTLFMVTWPPVTPEDLRHQLTGQTGMQALRNAWNSDQLTLELRTESPRHLAEERLPARWDAGLRELKGGIDVFPWELTYLPANDLPWRPSLALQQYLGYTHSLDQAMAERLGSQSGPAALLLEFGGLGGRHMMLDTPLAFQQIFAGYEPVETDYAHNLLWIRRRASGPNPSNAQIVGSIGMRFGEWVMPPQCEGKLFAQFLIRPNFPGLIREILWKTSPVLLRLEYENGGVSEFRMLPATASGGVLVNYLPRTLQDLADLMAGCAFDKVRRFQIVGPGTSSFHQDFQVNWMLDNSPFVDYSHVHQRPPPEVISVVPDSLERQTRMVTVTAGDGDGYRRLRYVQLIAGETNDVAGACYLRYQIDNRVLWLMKGADDSTGVGLLGSPQVLENGRCTVNLAGSWPEFRGDTVTLHLDIALKPAVRATQRVFARAVDENGTASKLIEFASWKPTRQALENPWVFQPTPPSVSIEHKKLAGSDRHVVTVRVSDLNGAADIAAAEVLVNNILDGRHSCYLRYDRNANTVSLRNDDGTAYTGPIELGSTKQLSNSYCAIAVPEAAVVKKPYDVAFSFEVGLTKKMSDKRTVWAAAVDREGLRQNWRDYAPLQ